MSFTLKTSAANAKVFQVISGNNKDPYAAGDVRVQIDIIAGTITMTHKQQRDFILSQVPFASITNGDTAAVFADIAALQTWVETHCFPS
jgi:hypothetical protein